MKTTVNWEKKFWGSKNSQTSKVSSNTHIWLLGWAMPQTLYTLGDDYRTPWPMKLARTGGASHAYVMHCDAEHPGHAHTGHTLLPQLVKRGDQLVRAGASDRHPYTSHAHTGHNLLPTRGTLYCPHPWEGATTLCAQGSAIATRNLHRVSAPERRTVHPPR